MSKITLSAKGQNCTIRLPGVCNFNNETTVLCHISGIRFKHGVAQKVNDILAAYGCSSCHDAIDGRVKTNYTKDELKIAHYEGVFETQIILSEMGLI